MPDRNTSCNSNLAARLTERRISESLARSCGSTNFLVTTFALNCRLRMNARSTAGGKQLDKLFAHMPPIQMTGFGITFTLQLLANAQHGGAGAGSG